MNARVWSVRGLLVALIALALSVSLTPHGQTAVVCEQVSGDPGEEVTLHVAILDPADGAFVPPTSGCGGTVTVTGTFFVDAPPPLFDFYIVIDASGSADADSGSDVDGDDLVTAVSDCGGEGTAGFARTPSGHLERPPRDSTASCP